MRNILHVILFLSLLTVRGQELQDLIDDNGVTTAETSFNKNTYRASTTPLDQDAFIRAARNYDIPYRVFQDSKETPSGYYAIAGVFENDKKLDKEVKKLNRKGFNAGYFLNPANNLFYLYLNKYTTWRPALTAIDSKFNNSYSDQVWALMVANGKEEEIPEPTEEMLTEAVASSASSLQDKVLGNEEPYPGPKSNTSTEETRSEANAKIPVRSQNMETEAEEPNTVTTSNALTGEMWTEANTDYPIPSQNIAIEKEKSYSGPKSGLLKKADEYFNKMWYAEAADLYEMALKNNEKNYSYDVLQKAGDAHYYNTNMEQAYKWYTILYDTYGDNLSANNIFKYAHALKGNGKYGRSKRLMRLYDKKIKEEGIAQRVPEKREMVLDEILDSHAAYDLKNLAINTEYSDFSPMYYKDEVVFASAKDSSVFSTRRYKWDNQPYLDLYAAKLNKESQELKDAVKFSKAINTKYHEAAVTFSPNGETMYFTRNNYGKKLRRSKKGENNLKIYMSKKVDGEWTEATELPFNSDEYSTGHPTLSEDGKKMYFVSDMPGSMGDSDIFVVDVLEDGSFSTPKNLGPEVNTEQKEMFPYILDSKLYFSSNGHTGLGGLDIYEATMSEEGGFGNVKNLGKPINSNKDDFSYIIDKENKNGFFASNRDGGKGRDDIYSFTKILPEEAPEITNAIAGVVVDVVTGEVLPKALVELLDENNVKLKEMEAEVDGSFIFEDLEADTKYVLRTNRPAYLEHTMNVATLENDTVNVTVAMKKLQEMIALENGIKKIKTEMIHFDFDKYSIRPDAAKELNKLVEVMNEYPNMVIKIESHTDSRGSRAYNEYLSDNRAKATRDYIVSRGIAPERIQSAIGYGEDRLLNECNGTVACSEEKHYFNRRSEFIIENM